VGYSWGGLLALLYALAAAEDGDIPTLGRLVLIDPAPLTRSFRTALEQEFQRRQSAPEIADARRALNASGLRERDPMAYRQRAFELSVAGYFANPAASHQLTPFRVMGKVQESVWLSLGDYDVIAQLERIRSIASLIVHGWFDPIPIDSSYLAARALSSRFVVLEASGHVPHVEQPQTLFTLIDQFLDDSEPTNRPSAP
jgi:proline iminopeptidase